MNKMMKVGKLNCGGERNGGNINKFNELCCILSNTIVMSLVFMFMFIDPKLHIK